MALLAFAASANRRTPRAKRNCGTPHCRRSPRTDAVLTRRRTVFLFCSHVETDGADARPGASRWPVGKDHLPILLDHAPLRSADLERLLGDVPFSSALGSMRCEQCRRRDYLVGALTIPTAEERTRIKLRRLADVRYVRRVIWHDDR